MQVYRIRNRLESETDFLLGQREDTLTKNCRSKIKIARRKIKFDQSVLLAKNLTMFF